MMQLKYNICKVELYCENYTIEIDCRTNTTDCPKTKDKSVLSRECFSMVLI
jgi:hypothetical protein